MNSCSTEFRLSSNLQHHKDRIHVLCSFPDHLYLSNAKISPPEGLSSQEESAFYDSIFYQSDYIQYVDDTIFLRVFRETTKAFFESRGFTYHEVGELNPFLASDGMLYLVKFKQLELEERWEPYHQEEVLGEMKYEEDFWINGLSLNAWMDVAKVNDTVEIQRELYDESILTDQVEGLFFQNQWTGDVHYQYRLDTLFVSDIGELKTKSAHELSYFIINYIINKEIRDQLNYLEGLEPNNSWYLSPNSGRIIPNQRH